MLTVLIFDLFQTLAKTTLPACQRRKTKQSTEAEQNPNGHGGRPKTGVQTRKKVPLVDLARQNPISNVGEIQHFYIVQEGRRGMRNIRKGQR